MSILYRHLIYLSVIGFGYFFLDQTNNNYSNFIFLTLSLIIIGVNEILIIRKELGKDGLFSPVVISTIVFFRIYFGISNYLYVTDRGFFLNTFQNRHLSYERYYWLKLAMLWANFAMIAMWAGYGTKFFSDFIFRITKKIFLFNKYLITNYKINFARLFAVYIFSILTKIYSFTLGIYGWTSNFSAVQENTNKLFILNLANSLSWLVLFLISIEFFRNRNFRTSMIVILTIEFIFGLLSGMKGGLVFPLIIVGIAYYYVNHKISFQIVILLIVLIFFAYSIIEPFREKFVFYKSRDITPDISLIIDHFSEYSLTNNSSDDIYRVPVIDAFFSRQNLSIQAATAFSKVIDTHQAYPEFLTINKLILSPLLAFVPRIIWPNKPEQNSGGLYNIVVLKNPVGTSISPSTLGYIVLDTANPIYIIPIFFLIGIFQRVIFKFFMLGGGGLLIYFSLLMYFVTFDDPYTSFVNYFRLVPMVMVLQYFILQRNPEPAAKLT